MKRENVLAKFFLEKSIAIMLIFIIVFAHAYALLCSISIAKEITSIEDIKINIQQELEKHVGMIYEDDTNGVLVQSKVKINMENFEQYKDDIIVKSTKITIRFIAIITTIVIKYII